MEAVEYTRMDAAEQGMWWYRALHARLTAALARVEGPVLDAGCGTGGMLAALARARPALPTIGLDHAALGVARAAIKSGRPVVRGSLNALPFAPASFAAAIAADVLCHAGVEPPQALGELHRVLRPGGVLIVNMPAYSWLMSAHDRAVHNVRRQTRGAVVAMLAAAGFTTIRARYWNSLLLPLMVAHRALARAEASDVAPFPPWLDRALHRMTEIERRLALPYPAGGSVLATARRG